MQLVQGNYTERESQVHQTARAWSNYMRCAREVSNPPFLQHSSLLFSSLHSVSHCGTPRSSTWLMRLAVCAAPTNAPAMLYTKKPGYYCDGHPGGVNPAGAYPADATVQTCEAACSVDASCTGFAAFMYEGSLWCVLITGGDICTLKYNGHWDYWEKQMQGVLSLCLCLCLLSCLVSVLFCSVLLFSSLPHAILSRSR